jgi:hypothetical protein
MSITVPQMFLLSHAIYVNHERSERRFKREREEPEREATPMHNGKPVSELDSNQMKMYWGSFLSEA